MEINISNCTLSYLPQCSQLLNNSACFCKYTAGIQKQSPWSTALLKNHLVFKHFTGLLENDQNEALNSLNIFFPFKSHIQIFSILSGLFTSLCNSQF